MAGIQPLAGAGIFSSPHVQDSAKAPPPGFYPTNTSGYFPGDKVTGA